MKNIIKFITFITYTVSIFFINDLRLLVGLFLLNFIIAIILKTNLKRMFYNFRVLLPFIVFTVLINIFFDSLYDGIIIGIRIMICYNITYIFSKTITVLEVADTIQKICYPLKMFKINTNNIGMIVSISICMIPVLKSEIHAISQAMKSKGKLVKINSTIIIMKSMLISILRRTNQIEKTLIAKAYMEI